MPPTPLNEIMRSEFAQAKRWLFAVAAIQWALAIAAVFAILANAAATIAMVLTAFLGPISSFVCREIGSHFYGKGERVRRLLLLQEGLGREPSVSDLLEIRRGEASPVASEPPPLGPYYASSSSDGFARLLYRVQESAFWTSGLAMRTALIHYVVAGAGVLAALVTAVVLLSGAAADGSIYPRLFAALLVFFLSGTTMTSARSYHSLGAAADKVATRADKLRRHEVDPIDLYKLMSAYDCALAKALPIPSYVYRHMQPKLQAVWDSTMTPGAGGGAS